MIQKKPDNDNRKTSRYYAAYFDISWIAQNYRIMLTQQSDRSFPRTKFTSAILEDSRKNGNDYLGVIICVVLTLLTNRAKTILNN